MKKITCIEIIPHTKNAKGETLGGECVFSDGKSWAWGRSHHTKEIFFTIDSGVPSQWGRGNYGRMISPPKRVEAFEEKFKEMGLK